MGFCLTFILPPLTAVVLCFVMGFSCGAKFDSETYFERLNKVVTCMERDPNNADQGAFCRSLVMYEYDKAKKKP